MINLQTVNEFTATIPVANNAEQCAHGERLATAQALGNRTHNLNGRLATVEQLTTVTSGALLPYAGALNSLADITLPDIGGTQNVVKNMGAALAAWIKYGLERIPGIGLTDQTQSFAPVVIGGLNATWAFQDAASVPYLNQQVLDSGAVYLALPLPRHGYLKAVSVTLLPDSGHGALPATKPRLSVGRIVVNSLDQVHSYSELAAANDSSADVTAYHATHQISLSGLSVLLTATPYKQFYLKFTGESGANSVLNLKLLSVSTTIGGAP